MFLLTVMGLLTLASVYMGVRLLPALSLNPDARAVAIAVLCLPVLLAGAGIIARILHSRRARLLTWAGSLTLGWVSTLFVLTLLREPVLAVAALVLPAAEAAAVRMWSAVAVPVLASLATLLGLAAAIGRPRIVEVTIPLVGLVRDLEGFTIAQISDLHVGRTIRRSFVERVVAAVNRLDADLVAITGDLVDGTVAELAPQVAPLARLRSPHGTYFVTGNHEYYSGVDGWIAELRRVGIHVLINEHVVIQHGAARLIVAGITDPVGGSHDLSHRSDPQAALRGAPDRVRPRILLAHRPRSAAAAERAGFDLQLSGHTHGGQFWPWNLVVRYQEPLSIGLDRLGRLWVYTSRGTGFWGPPQRLGVPAEITRLRLVAASEASSPALPNRAGDLANMERSARSASGASSAIGAINHRGQ